MYPFILKISRRRNGLARTALLVLLLLLGECWGNTKALFAQAVGRNLIVISQVYGGGGNSGATYKNDFVELFNRGSSTVSLSGWTIQYAVANSGFSAGSILTLSGTLAPGHYYLIQLAAGTGGTTDLPTPDRMGTISMAASAGKVALASNSDVVAGSTDANVVDFVGYGSTASDAEGGSPTAAPSATKSISRNSDGCTDTDNNQNDFMAGSVSPRNSSTPANICGAQLTAAPAALANFVTTTGMASDEQSYALMGTGLNSAATITAPAGYQVALTAGGPYQGSVLTDAPNGGSLSATVYVVLDGTTAGGTTGSITNVSGSITATITVTGTSDVPVTQTQTVRWDGGANTKFWFDAANWSTDAVPGPDADVVLDHTLVPGGYQVLLQSRTTTASTVEPAVSIQSLTVNPAGGEAITFEIPVVNTNGSALTIKRDGPKEVALAIYNKGVVTNSTGPNSSSAGAGLTVAGSNPTVYIYNGGTYRHYTNRSHVVVLENLAAVSGTENGLWEFRLATTSSSSLALSKRSYPTLVLRANPNTPTTSYTGSGSALTIRGSLAIDKNVTFAPNITGDLSIAGNVENQGDVRFSPTTSGKPATGRLVLNGTAPQLLSGTALGLKEAGATSYLTSGVTVQINNSGGGVILATPVTISGTLQLATGLLNTNVTNVLTLAAGATFSGGGPGSFVNGPMDYAASGPVTLRFPLGRNNAAGSAYRPLTLAITKLGTATTFRAVQVEGRATGNLSGLTRINQARYFVLTPTPALATGTFESNVTLSFGADDRVTNPEANTLVIAGNDGTGWVNLSRSANTGTAANGTLTSGTLTSLNWITLASTDPNSAQNPLPVELTAFTVQRNSTGALLRWTTATELNCREFEVWRSFDGESYIRLASLLGHGTINQSQTYQYIDATLGLGAAYYQLRQVDTDGRSTNSPVRFVAPVPGSVQAYPNPVIDQFTLYAPAPVTFRLLNEVGTVVYQGVAAAGTTRHSIAQLPAGVYVLEIQLSGQPVTRRKLLKTN